MEMNTFESLARSWGYRSTKVIQGLAVECLYLLSVDQDFHHTHFVHAHATLHLFLALMTLGCMCSQKVHIRLVTLINVRMKINWSGYDESQLKVTHPKDNSLPIDS